METISLKQARLMRGITQEHLASLLGVHVQTYRKLEENPEGVTIGQAKLLADVLDMPYNVIFFGKQALLKVEQ